MDNEKRLQLITYFFWAVIFIIALLGVTVVFGVMTLVQSQKWVDHTNKVSNEIKLVRKNFDLADFAGRNRIFNPANEDTVIDLRRKTFESINELKPYIADNQEQIENIQSLETAVRSRFEVQDEQAKSVIRDGDKVIYDLTIVSKSIAFTETIDTLFYQLEVNELNLMRLERAPKLAFWQWVITDTAFVIISMLLLFTIILFALCRKLLRRLLRLDSKIEEFIQNSDSENALQKDAVKFGAYIYSVRDFIKGETDDLPDHFITSSD